LLLSGRYVEIKMLPLSFREYVESTGTSEGLARKYREYLENSSFPYTLELTGQKKEIRDYLDAIYNTVIVKDIGLRSMLLGSRSMDVGHILENVVYLELIRRGYDVYVGKVGDLEVDFVAMDFRGITYYQVAATVRDEKTLKREITPLEKIADYHPRYILTLDEDPEANYNGIRRINALDWLLGSK